MAKTDATTKCRGCGRAVSPTNVRCPSCKKRVRPLSARPVTPSPPPIAPVTPRCQRCRRWPATTLTFREVTGLVLAFRVTTTKGRFCRQCGTDAFRQATRRTLLIGWWGIAAVFANLFVLGANLCMRRRVRALGAPRS